MVCLGQGKSVPPFQVKPYGVVSLLAMLEFYARKYLDIVHRFGLLLGHGQPLDPDVVRDVWTDLMEEAVRLDLPVTKQFLDSLVMELVDNDATKCKLLGEGKFEISGAILTNERIRHHAEAVYKTLTAELGSLKLRAIPSGASPMERIRPAFFISCE